MNISVTIHLLMYFGKLFLFASRITHPRRHNVIALFVNMVFSDEDKILTKNYIS